jgi:hypothetical protein
MLQGFVAEPNPYAFNPAFPLGLAGIILAVLSHDLTQASVWFESGGGPPALQNAAARVERPDNF